MKQSCGHRGKFMRNASCVVEAASGSAERFQKVDRFLSH